MSIEGQGHFFTIYFPCFVLYKATISGERLQDHWSSGLISDSVISQFNISSPPLSESGGVKGMSSSGSILLAAFMFLKCS